MTEQKQVIPKGFKLTEVGLIPEDWQIYKFGELVNYKKGYPFKSADYSDFGTRIIRVSDTTYSTIEDSNPVYISVEEGKKYNAWELKAEDLVFSTVGSKPPMYDSLVGKVVMISDCHSGSLLNQNAVRIRSKSNAEGFQYLLLSHFRTKRYIDHIELIYRGNANQASITLENLFEFKIPLPTNEKEQTAIANALSDVDALISELEKLIAKKQAIKTATMQQLLTGKTRLPQFALREDGTPKGYKASELGEIPEDWEVVLTGQICDVLTGFPFPSSMYSNTGVRLLRGSNVKRNCTDWDDSITEYWPELTSNLKQYELSIGDIAISMDGSLVGRSFAQLSENDLPAVLLQRVARLRGKLISQNYLKEWICSKFFTEHCDAVKTVTAIPHISPSDINNFKILKPSTEDEQSVIALTLSNMDDEIQTLQQRLNKTRQIKQGMMQELLTGKTRLI